MTKSKNENFYKKWKACEKYASHLNELNMALNMKLTLSKAIIVVLCLAFMGALGHGWIY